MKIYHILQRLKSNDYSKYLETKKGENNKTIQYIPWYRYPDILDNACGEDGIWSLISETQLTDTMVVVNTSISIIDSDGNNVTRTGTGNELIEVLNIVDEQMTIKKQKKIPYGDPTSNATAQAIRRTMALFGVVVDLWERDRESTSQFTMSKADWERKFKANKQLSN